MEREWRPGDKRGLTSHRRDTAVVALFLCFFFCLFNVFARMCQPLASFPSLTCLLCTQLVGGQLYHSVCR